MFVINETIENKYKVYELKDTENDSWMKIIPERGGILVGLGFEGEELLFLNKDTLYNEEANVRGGNPILFPISGQLENGEYEWNGQFYKMKNHGFARNLPWEVIETKSDGELSLTLKLSSNEETRKSYPFDFELIFTYKLLQNKLVLLQEYINKSNEDMPIYAGFHPYFKTSNKRLVLDTDASGYVDYNDMQFYSLENGVADLNDKKESFTLLDTKRRDIGFALPELGKQVRMEYGEEFKYVVVWTEEGQDFVCVEPWMAKTGELNNKEELIYVKAGRSLQTMMSIGIES